MTALLALAAIQPNDARRLKRAQDNNHYYPLWLTGINDLPSLPAGRGPIIETVCLVCSPQFGWAIAMSEFRIPKKLLDRIVIIEDAPVAVAMCPDFELGSWRYKQLAEHLFDWLPDVALRPAERDVLLYEPNKQLSHAAKRLFDTQDPSARGEIGEILVHAICRQEFSTTPFVARLFYKMRTNDSVTSVDVVHFLLNPKTSELELWLGEAKIYSNLAQAKLSALKSVAPLWDGEFLAEMKALIGPKLELSVSGAEALAWLFSDETSLDKIVDRLVIPICIACDFEPTKEASSRTAQYIEKVQDELLRLRSYLIARVPAKIRIVCIFVPMDDKKKLETAVNVKLQAFL